MRTSPAYLPIAAAFLSMAMSSVSTAALAQAAAPAVPQAASSTAPQAGTQPADRLPPPPDLREEAFKGTVDSVLPLSPQQIKALRQFLDQGQKQASTPPGPAPKPESRSEDVSLEPGAKIPVVRLGANHVSMLAFYDSSGQQWPVLKVVVGNADRVQVMAMGDGSNAISVTPQVYHGTTNIGVILEKASMPLTVSLAMDAGQAATDAQVSFRVQARGPNAQAPIIQPRAPEAGNPVLMAFLDGTPPEGAQPLFLGAGTGRAWSFGGYVYLRTQMTLLSPSWLGSVAGSGGFTVYQLPDTPVILASDQGRQLSIRLTDAPKVAQKPAAPAAAPNQPVRIAGPASAQTRPAAPAVKSEAPGN